MKKKNMSENFSQIQRMRGEETRRSYSKSLKVKGYFFSDESRSSKKGNKKVRRSRAIEKNLRDNFCQNEPERRNKKIL